MKLGTYIQQVNEYIIALHKNSQVLLNSADINFIDFFFCSLIISEEVADTDQILNKLAIILESITKLLSARSSYFFKRYFFQSLTRPEKRH